MSGTVHFIFAFAALASGMVVICQPKGGQRHRVCGYAYSISMLLMNLSALFVYEDSSSAGPFHILALISLATLICGFIPALLHRPASSWIDVHAYFMSWSYVGLVAAGFAQVVTMSASLPQWITVGVPSVLIVLTGGIVIHTRVRRTLLVFASANRPVNRDRR